MMYVHALGVILRRDLEMCQLRDPRTSARESGHGGIIHHVLQRLPFQWRSLCGPDEWRQAVWKKLRGFCFLVNLKQISSAVCQPDVSLLVDLAYSILSKNSSSGDPPGSGCSPDIAKSMIDGGLISAYLWNGNGQQVPNSNGRICHSASQNHSNENVTTNPLIEQEMRTEQEEANSGNPLELGLDYMRDEMEDNGVLNDTEQIGMGFMLRIKYIMRMGEEDDDMGDDGEDDEDDDEGEDEDEDIVEDGTA
ncbi:E3 ubiquitin- protein ligase upl1 [Datura stramonium]|uniref:E3 ubiquitin- protein ligase upl1 n=1 Tax=Datura stramonium TaxID=4076 RepID=A0ABS8SB05_DATST|nr:E3 ubiquitin- protein ligase upl1 [Datura stramonium]